ncbi:hypothetical protein C8R41DRAFT_944225 [Lentinula lateritia]|uniref:Uncharacterized protein n=1 Tax=Lentinula lateritia TaxID=40482 RepID=A0ABQ8VQ39_9AGAR|nr:hypothetical protein C8R41DRAFT_944225 [Lentinula lateritia]
MKSGRREPSFKCRIWAAKLGDPNGISLSPVMHISNQFIPGGQSNDFLKAVYRLMPRSMFGFNLRNGQLAATAGLVYMGAWSLPLYQAQFKDDDFVFYTLHCGQDNNFSKLDIVSSFKVQIIRDPRAENCLLGPVNNIQKASAEYLTVVTQNDLGPELTNSQSGIRHDDTQPVVQVFLLRRFFSYQCHLGVQDHHLPAQHIALKNLHYGRWMVNFRPVNLSLYSLGGPPIHLTTMRGGRSPSVSSFASEGYFIDPARGRGSSVVSDASESSFEHIDPRLLAPDIQSRTVYELPFSLNSQGSEGGEGRIRHTQVATKKTRMANEKRRKKGARFHCKVPGCHGSFTAKHNLIIMEHTFLLQGGDDVLFSLDEEKAEKKPHEKYTVFPASIMHAE